MTTARLGQVESTFNALKGGNLIGGADAGRTRIRERHVHEALIALAFLGRVALTTADQRIKGGTFQPKPLGGVNGSTSPSPVPDSKTSAATMPAMCSR